MLGEAEGEVMCLWNGLGCAGFGNGPPWGYGWSGGRRPGLQARSAQRSGLSWEDCRVPGLGSLLWGCPQHTDCCCCSPLDCWCSCSHCWMTQNPRHPDPALETGGELCLTSWPEGPAGHSPLHSCAGASCFQSTYENINGSRARWNLENASKWKLTLCVLVTFPFKKINCH